MEWEMDSKKLAKLLKVTQGEMDGAKCELEPVHQSAHLLSHLFLKG